MLWHCLSLSAESEIPLGERTMPQAYHRLFWVVSKCALREKKEEGPRFPGDLPSEI